MPVPLESEFNISRCLSGLVKQNLGKRGIDLTLRRKLSVQSLPSNLREFVEKSARLCQPSDIYVVDGTVEENKNILEKLVKDKTVVPVKKYKNSYLARTDPRDVARVESKTFICTKLKHDSVPRGKGVSQLGNWMSEEDMDKAVNDRFLGSMKDRTMYVIPFSMGPVGGPMSKLCLQLTDSAYVVASTRIMTRMGEDAFDMMRKTEGKGVVRALHSVGRSSSCSKSWPCDPERTIILHRPADQLIVSYGSGYGGNSLLGKKCLALRLGSTLAKEEGWLAEHMLILGIEAPGKPKRYIAAAFPSACGKTNLAMLKPSLPGYQVQTVGDDIAWIKYNSRTGMLHAINPEFGFFGVAPGTSWKTNPNAMATITKNSLFTNVAETSDGGVWWEGMEKPANGVQIIDWHGNEWKEGNAAHPNSRFTAPAGQCPCIDPAWEDPEGVPLSAILFGGRRPQGVPLVYESFNWEHGVFLGAAMRSEATAAAEHKGKVIMHDPFAMRPFFGYNAGHYMEHWLSMNDRYKTATLPKIFHVNWFRKGNDGKFLWPGFGDNIRVIDWILKRVDGEGEAQKTPIGYIPTPNNSLNTKGLDPKPNMEELLSVPNEFWKKEAEEIQKYFDEQLGEDLPKRIQDQLLNLKNRLNN